MLMSGSLIAQQDNLWSTARIDPSDLEVQQGFELKKNYRAFELEFGDFKSKLFAKERVSDGNQQSEIKVSFPMANGELVSFLLHDNSVMHPNLAKKFPNNRSFSGSAVNDPSLKINLSVNILGLHAMIIDRTRKVQYIDPLKVKGQGVNRVYQVYKREDIKAEKQGISCQVEAVEIVLNKQGTVLKSFDKKLRTYRLAMAVTGEYSQYHLEANDALDKNREEQKEIIMATIETAITRINYLYEKDLAVHLELVENNDTLIFFNDNNPYTEYDISNMLNQNQAICDRLIGTDNYDIGHVMGTMGIGQGIPAVCNRSTKAQGASGGGDHPTEDSFYFDMVAHEIGHQFGANHSFNGNSGGCEGRRNNATAMEPGSGTTIMGYAGSCEEYQNVQLRSDLYFHTVSIEEIWTHISGAGQICAKTTPLTDNLHSPTADAGADFTIPKGTPFKLVGGGKDADGDPLTYCWEQIDNEIGRVPPTEKDKIGTLYRSYPPVESNTRYLPALKELRNGNISTKWEVTPAVGRELNFSLTVRDNNDEAGQVAIDHLKVNVSDVAGPFLVTSQNTAGLVLEQNSDQLVRWDVAGTTTNGVDASKVNILLSTDGGLNFDTLLKSDTDNDGSETVRIPFYTAGSCYIMVEAVDNYFFALNQQPFSIKENNNSCNYTASTDVPVMIPDNDLQGIQSTINFEKDLNVEDLSITVDIEHPFVWDINLEIESPEGTRILLMKKTCFESADNIQVVFSDQGEAIRCRYTVPGIRGEIMASELLSSFSGESTKGQWTLKVVDAGNGDIGRLVSWGMTVCAYDEVLASKAHLLKGFRVYPNPAENSFQISFDLKSDAVEIQLVDALGRTVIQRNYQSNSLKFEERINTEYLNGGIYFLKVINGGFSAMEKVVIK